MLKTLLTLFALALGLNGGPHEVTQTDSASAAKYRPSIKKTPSDKGKMDADRCIARRGDTRSKLSRCTYGKKDGDRTVVLMGDSHALQYGPAMIGVAKKRNWRLIALMRQSCVVAQVKYDKTCDTWRKNTMRSIVRDIKPDMVVISTGTVARYRVKRGGRTLSRKASEPHLKRGMVKTLKRLRKTGTRVVVIRDQARSPFFVHKCLRKKPARKCSFKGGGRTERGPFDAKAARAVKKVKLIDPFGKLCPKGRCPGVVGKVIVYRDRYHLTATYARTLTPWLDRKLPRGI
ncbi:MAG: hypothetical protein M3Y23_06490 [Actinomycetota bacterium]|nr:hypothetical protein [Actinomycetota bacterium]